MSTRKPSLLSKIRPKSLAFSFYAFVGIMLVIFVGTRIVAAKVIQSHLNSRLVSDYNQQQLTIANQTGQTLRNEVASVEDKLRYVAEIDGVKSLDPAVCNARLDQFFESFGTSLGNLGRVDAKGVFYCSHNRQIIGSPGSSFGSYIPEIISDPQHMPVLSRMIKPKGSTTYLLAAHIPVYDKAHTFIGTLGGGISVDALAKNILSKIKIGQHGYVSVFDDNGDIIYSQTATNIGKNRYSPEIKRLTGSSSPQLTAAFESVRKDGVSQTVAYSVKGQQRYATMVRVQIIPGRNWIIYGVSPKSDIALTYQNLGINNAINSLTAISGTLLLIMLGLIAGYVYIRVIKPISYLAKAGEEIQGGNLHKRIEHMSGNEIGELGRSLNTMLEKLDSYQDDLEKDVAAKTNELAGKIQKIESQNVELEQSKTAMLNILEDLNEQKSAAERAKLRDEALLSSIGEGLVVIDAEGNISSINTVGRRMLGFTEKELLGKWFPGTIKALDDKGEEIEAMERPVIKALSTGKVVSTPAFYRRKDGQLFPVNLTVSPVILDGAPIGAVEVFRDITKERELEQAKEEFVSLASHQLRTPATGVKAYLSMLKDGYGGELTTQQTDFVAKAEDSNERQLKIIDDMLQVARADSGRMSLAPSDFDLVKMIDDILTEQKATIEERRQKLDYSHPKPPLMISADASKLRMAVENFVSNASKYTPEGGAVSVELKTTATYYCLAISDTGVGISKDNLSKLFKRFSRIDNPLSAKVGGTGLGLYLSGKIIELHHGSIKVTSEEGKGTTFVIKIPRIIKTAKK